MSLKKNFLKEKLQGQNNLVIITLAVVLFAGCSLAVPKFFSKGNVMSLLGQLALYSIPCMGLAFVMNMSGNDFAIAAQMTFAGVVAALLMTKAGMAPWLAILITLLLGTACGVLLGSIIAILHAPGFIVTLTSQLLFTGLALVLTNAGTVSGLPQSFNALGGKAIGGITWPVIIMVVMTVFLTILMHKTPYGRSLTAAGVNRKAAYLAGINVIVLEASTYAISGFCSALAGIMMTAKIGAATSSVGALTIIDIIAGCVIGGNSLNGGTGNVIGAFSGMATICILNKLLSMLGVTYDALQLIKGVLIVVVVLLDYIKNTASEKALIKR